MSTRPWDFSDNGRVSLEIADAGRRGKAREVRVGSNATSTTGCDGESVEMVRESFEGRAAVEESIRELFAEQETAAAGTERAWEGAHLL